MGNTMINRFDGTEFGFLSNFFPSKIKYNGFIYRTVEHAFQAAKTLDTTEQKKIREANSPGKAKRLGRKAAIREDWESVKISIMEECLRLKFAIPNLRDRLLETGDEELVEGTDGWCDNVWGICSCDKCKGSGKKGQNNLGKLLMKIRKEIREAQKNIK